MEKIGLLVEVVVVIAIGLTVWFILSGGIKEAFGNVINPIKEKLGLGTKDVEKQKETERVNKELSAKAEIVYAQFNDILKKCITEYSEDTSCICGTMDFTNLNKYNLVLSNELGYSTLELSDSNKVPVAGKRSGVGRLLMLHSSAGLLPNNNKLFDDYSKRLTYVLFSKDKVHFNLAGTEVEKYEGSMTNIFLRKFTNNVLVVDDARYGARDCKAEEQPFGYIRR